MLYSNSQEERVVESSHKFFVEKYQKVWSEQKKMARISMWMPISNIARKTV